MEETSGRLTYSLGGTPHKILGREERVFLSLVGWRSWSWSRRNMSQGWSGSWGNMSQGE